MNIFFINFLSILLALIKRITIKNKKNGTSKIYIYIFLLQINVKNKKNNNLNKLFLYWKPNKIDIFFYIIMGLCQQK